MRIVAEVKTPFLHSQFGVGGPSFTESAMRQIAKQFHGELIYLEPCGLLLARGALSQSAKMAVENLKGRTVL